MKTTISSNRDFPVPFAESARYGYIGRMRVYLREMYPIPSGGLYAFLMCSSVGTMLGIMTGGEVRMTLQSLLLGTFTVFSLGLILRLMDELKDRDIDRALFAHRPLPSGRVSEQDIVRSLIAAVAIYLAVHVVCGLAMEWALALLAYAGLMFRFFFVPKRWRGLLAVNLLTHNPVAALLVVYLGHLFTNAGSQLITKVSGVELAVLVAIYWPLLLSWEIARKIRYRHEETNYVTYSRLIGPTAALLVALGVQTASLLTGLWAALKYDTTPAYPAVMVFAYLLLLAAYTRFHLGRLDSGHQLKAVAEQYAALVMAAPLVERVVEGVVSYVR